MVQLLVRKKNTISRVTVFQFQYGAIIRSLNAQIEEAEKQFQFQYGAIISSAA